MNTQLENPYTITFHRTRDHSLKLRGGAQLEPTTPSGQRRIWQPPQPDHDATADEPKERYMNAQLKDSYTITFHCTRDHSLKLRGGARLEPTTPSGQRRIWQPPPPDHDATTDKPKER